MKKVTSIAQLKQDVLNIEGTQILGGGRRNPWDQTALPRTFIRRAWLLPGCC